MSNGIAYPDVLSNVDMPGRSAPTAASGSRLNITVCDPVKQDQGINAYITYKVICATHVPSPSLFALFVGVLEDQACRPCVGRTRVRLFDCMQQRLLLSRVLALRKTLCTSG